MMSLAGSSQFAGSFLNEAAQRHASIAVSAIAVCVLVATVLLLLTGKLQKEDGNNNGLITYAKSVYAMFLKPHEGDGDGGQQGALESFYRTQVRSKKKKKEDESSLTTGKGCCI